jgi:hypothetical protein
MARPSGTLGWAIGKLDGVPYYSKPGGGFGFHGNVHLPDVGCGNRVLAGQLYGNLARADLGWIDAPRHTLYVLEEGGGFCFACTYQHRSYPCVSLVDERDLTEETKLIKVRAFLKKATCMTSVNPSI